MKEEKLPRNIRSKKASDPDKHDLSSLRELLAKKHLDSAGPGRILDDLSQPEITREPTDSQVQLLKAVERFYKDEAEGKERLEAYGEAEKRREAEELERAQAREETLKSDLAAHVKANANAREAQKFIDESEALERLERAATLERDLARQHEEALRINRAHDRARARPHSADAGVSESDRAQGLSSLREEEDRRRGEGTDRPKAETAPEKGKPLSSAKRDEAAEDQHAIENLSRAASGEEGEAFIEKGRRERAARMHEKQTERNASRIDSRSEPPKGPPEPPANGPGEPPEPPEGNEPEKRDTYENLPKRKWESVFNMNQYAARSIEDGLARDRRTARQLAQDRAGAAAEREGFLQRMEAYEKEKPLSARVQKAKARDLAELDAKEARAQQELETVTERIRRNEEKQRDYLERCANIMRKAIEDAERINARPQADIEQLRRHEAAMGQNIEQQTIAQTAEMKGLSKWGERVANARQRSEKLVIKEAQAQILAAIKRHDGKIAEFESKRESLLSRRSQAERQVRENNRLPESMRQAYEQLTAELERNRRPEAPPQHAAPSETARRPDRPADAPLADPGPREPLRPEALLKRWNALNGSLRVDENVLSRYTQDGASPKPSDLEAAIKTELFRRQQGIWNFPVFKWFYARRVNRRADEFMRSIAR